MMYELSEGFRKLERLLPRPGQDPLRGEFGMETAQGTALAKLAVRLRNGLGLLAGELSTASLDSDGDIRLVLEKILSAWSKGFTVLSYHQWGLDRNDHHRYLNIRPQLLETPRINGPVKNVIQNKLYSWSILQTLGASCPAIFATVRKGRIYGARDPSRRGPELIRSLLADQPNGIVIKPFAACKGLGIAFLKEDEGKFFVNGKEADFRTIETIFSKLDNYLVTEFAVQHEYSSRLYPRTTNTMRLLTLWDIERDEAFLAGQVHRIGTSRSYPVDNFKGGRGGLTVPIDRETGELGEAHHVSDEGRVVRTSGHPETDAPIEGVRVPRWQQMTGEIVRIAGLMPYNRLTSWDVIMTEKSYSIIEINAGTAFGVFQIIDGMVNDPRIRRFYEHYGLI